MTIRLNFTKQEIVDVLNNKKTYAEIAISPQPVSSPPKIKEIWKSPYVVGDRIWLDESCVVEIISVGFIQDTDTKLWMWTIEFKIDRGINDNG